MNMPLKTFLNRFFVGVGVLFTLRFLAVTIDNDFSFDVWYIFITALIFAIIFSLRTRKQQNV